MMQGHAEYRQVVQGRVGRYSGGEGLLSHVSAFFGLTGSGYLSRRISLHLSHYQTAVSSIVYEYTVSLCLRTSNT